jgi:hypothetical protein
VSLLTPCFWPEAHEDALFPCGIRGSFFRGASCSIKFRDPIDSSQMIDLAITWCKVNATKKIREFYLMGTIRGE